MNTYKIIAHIINPFDEEQKRNLGDSYAKVLSDYCFIQDKGFPLDERIARIKNYSIDGAIEKHNSEVPYFIDEDADGVYLLKKID